MNSQRAVSGDIPALLAARMKISQSPDSLQFEGSRRSFGRVDYHPSFFLSFSRCVDRRVRRCDKRGRKNKAPGRERLERFRK